MRKRDNKEFQNIYISNIIFTTTRSLDSVILQRKSWIPERRKDELSADEALHNSRQMILVILRKLEAL